MANKLIHFDDAGNALSAQKPDSALLGTAKSLRAVVGKGGVKAIVIPPPVADVRAAHSRLLVDIWNRPGDFCGLKALIRTDLKNGTTDPVKIVAPPLAMQFEETMLLCGYAYAFARCANISSGPKPHIVAVKLSTALADHFENRDGRPFLAAAFMQAGLGWKDRSGQIHAVERDSAIFSTSGVICATPRANAHMPPLYLTATLYQEASL
jgi:hypothetical protein